MTERDAAGPPREHFRRQALLEIAHDIAGDHLEEPIGSRGQGRNRFEQPPSRGRKTGCAREHRVADGVGNLIGLRPEHLGHEERIAGGLAEQLVRIQLYESARSATAAGESGPIPSRSTSVAVASSPSTIRSGCAAARSSSR